jgi:hypothetical protein
MEHQLLGGESNQGVGALIARRRRAEHDRRECGKGTRISRCSPRNEIFDVLTTRCGQNGEEKRRGRLASVAGRCNNPQCALTDPATASLVSERRTPTAATNDLSSGTPAVGDRAGSDDQKNPRAVFERIVHRDQAV